MKPNPSTDQIPAGHKSLGQEYTEEETAFLREVLKITKEMRRTNLTNVELFRLMKSLGYQKGG